MGFLKGRKASPETPQLQLRAHGRGHCGGGMQSRAVVHVRSATPLPKGDDNHEPSWVVTVQTRERGKKRGAGEWPQFTKPARNKGWNELLCVNLNGGDVDTKNLHVDIVDLSVGSRLSGFFVALSSLVPWNTYNVEADLPAGVRLRVSLCVERDDQAMAVQHLVHAQGQSLTLPARHAQGARAVVTVLHCLPQEKASEAIAALENEEGVPFDACPVQEGKRGCFIDAGIAEIGGKMRASARVTLAAALRDERADWKEETTFALGHQVKRVCRASAPLYPDALYDNGGDSGNCHICLLATFFLVERPDAGSGLLGYATLKMPKRFSLGEAVGVDAKVVQPGGSTLKGATFRAELKVVQVHAAEPEEVPETSLQDQLDAITAELNYTKNKLDSSGHEVERKQAVLVRLSQEVDKRTEAIKKCGAEIIKLRRHLEAVEHDRAQIKNDLILVQRGNAEAEMEVNRVIKAVTASTTDVGGNNSHLRLLARRCNTLMQENKEMCKMTQHMGEVRWHLAASQTENMRLKRAHKVQANYIRKMQGLHNKVSAYKATLATQDRVIAKLEEIVEGHIRPPAANFQPKRWRDDQEGRQERLGGAPEVETWQADPKGPSMAVRDRDPPPEGQDMLMLQAKDAKIKILEEQMVENAKQAAEDMATLKMRVLELEAASGWQPLSLPDVTSPNVHEKLYFTH